MQTQMREIFDGRILALRRGRGRRCVMQATPATVVPDRCGAHVSRWAVGAAKVC